MSAISDGVLASDGHRILLSVRVGTVLAQVYANFNEDKESVMFEIVDASSVGGDACMAGGIKSTKAEIMQVLDYDEMTNLLSDLAKDLDVPFNIVGEAEGMEN